MEHAAELPAWLHWTLDLEQSGLGHELRRSLFLYPIVEVLHILGFVLLVGSIAVVDLRLMGLLRRLDPAPLVRSVVPLTLLGLALAVPTGFLLFVTSASAIAVNPFFQAKLVLVALALINAVAFELVTFRRLAAGRIRTARRAGFVSLALWVLALAAGRLIAYI